MAIVINGSGTVTGITAQASDIELTDSTKLKLGTGDDLEVYHDGSDSIIADTGTGDLLISGSGTVRIDGSGETMINCADDGAVTLYHNNAAKIATSATGVTVTGAIAGATNLGKVLQVVQNTLDTSNFDTTSTSAVASGKSLSITPTTSGNKMLVTVSGLMYNSANTSSWGAVQIKDTTNGTFSASNDKIGRGSSEEQFTVSHLFTTTSTSSHNYEMWSGASDAGTKGFDNIQILIMEIAA